MNPHLLFRLVLLLVISSPAAHGVTNVWFAPNGKGDGSSRENPRWYYPDLLKWKLLGGDKRIDRTVIMHFLPGEYVIQPIDTETVYPSDFRITIIGEGSRPEDTVLKLVPNHPGGASDNGGNWVSVIDLARNNEYLQRFEMENITIDGNWDGHANYNHPGYLRSYKVSPLNVSARTGRLRKVIVRNFGAHGLMPQRLNDLGEGVEVFPLWVATRDEGQAPEDGDPAPWVVEDCEVSGFHTLYNGYNSSLMAVTKLNVPETPSWAFQDNSRRLIWFRRNQVRGRGQRSGTIGLGAAGIGTNYSGRITWSDTVVLNGSGFNTDTGALWDLDITNSLFLDVVSLGYLGTPFAGQPSHRRYRIAGNSIRIGGYLFSGHYTDFRFDGGLQSPKADPTLVLGRRHITRPAGLSVGGIASDISLVDNWFTTRPETSFRGRHLPPDTEASFLLLNRLPSKDPHDPRAASIPRFDALNVNLSGNQVSGVPFDFERLKRLDGGRTAKLGERSSPLQERRRPLPAPREGFQPFGIVERVVLIQTNAPRQLRFQGIPLGAKKPVTFETNYTDRVLMGACEVVIGTPKPAGPEGTFTVPVRVAIQPTPLGSLPGTRPLPRRTVCLEVLPGSLHPQKLTAMTDADGIATFTYSVARDANGVDRFRAWTDFGRGEREVWDEYQDAWSTAEFAHGTTVGVEMEVDVVDVRSGQPAIFRLVRQGPADAGLSVNLDYGSGSLAAVLGRDYELLLTARSLESGGTLRGTVATLVAGQRELELQARPKPGLSREGRLVTVEVRPGERYGIGTSPRGQAVVYAPAK